MGLGSCFRAASRRPSVAHRIQWYQPQRRHSCWRCARFVRQLDAYHSAQSSSVLSWRPYSTWPAITSRSYRSLMSTSRAAPSKLFYLDLMRASMPLSLQYLCSFLWITYQQHIIPIQSTNTTRQRLEGASRFLSLFALYALIIPQTPILASCYLFNQIR
jgi:hypothetical protein